MKETQNQHSKISRRHVTWLVLYTSLHPNIEKHNTCIIIIYSTCDDKDQLLRSPVRRQIYGHSVGYMTFVNQYTLPLLGQFPHAEVLEIRDWEFMQNAAATEREGGKGLVPPHPFCFSLRVSP